MADDDLWHELYQASAGTPTALAGLYHDNYVVTRGGSEYILRIPRASPADDVEPRMFAEGNVLAALGSKVPAPRLIHRSETPSFLVISRCPGRPLADTHPPGTPVPATLITVLAAALRSLYAVERADLGPLLPASPWGDGRTGNDFAVGLLAWLHRIHQRASPAEQEFLRSVGLPAEPFAPENHPLSGTSRRLRLCHGDFQRPNIFTDGRVHHLIDWELAVWGDPVWDVAAHLHRAGYPPVQQAEAQAVLLGTVPEWTSSAADRQDFAVFLRLERYRSLVLDALRHLRAGAAWEEGRRRAAVQEYGYKLAIAGLDVPAADLMALHVRFWERPAART